MDGQRTEVESIVIIVIIVVGLAISKQIIIIIIYTMLRVIRIVILHCNREYYNV